jgi:hypothetical protein
VQKLHTVLTCCLIVVCAFLPARVIRADAPEEKVWSDAPQKSEPSKIGRQNRAIELSRYQQIRYVSHQTGNDRAGDGSADKPWVSINHAIGQITDADSAKRYAILVSRGRYGGQTIQMREYVDLYGGFEPGDWHRDIFANRTILDGQHARRVVKAANSARLDGFIITAGKSPGHGGGVLCHRTSPIITNNIITGNTTLEPVGFVHDPDRRRHVGNDGGGIACVDGANPLIAHNILFSNTTEVGNGAGIACRDDACPKIIYNVIWANKTGLRDIHDTRSSNGGGISCFAGARPIINNNIITDNSAGGGAIRLSDQGLARITGNVIARNHAAGKGGGVACTNAWMILKNNTIVENSSKRAGGVIYYNENWPHLMPPILIHNTIRNNSDRQLDVGSEGARIEFNNIEGGFAGRGNIDKSPPFEDDRFKSTASAVTYDSNRCVTIFSCAGERFDGGSLAGRVIRVHEKWSMVKSGSRQELVVWGKLDDEGLDFEIMPSYYLCHRLPELTKVSKP